MCLLSKPGHKLKCLLKNWCTEHNLTVPHEASVSQEFLLAARAKKISLQIMEASVLGLSIWTDVDNDNNDSFCNPTTHENISKNIHSCKIMTVSFTTVPYLSRKNNFTANNIGLLFLFQRFQTTSQFSQSPFNMQLPWKQNAQFETNQKLNVPEKKRYELLFYWVVDVSATNTVRPNFE